MGVYSQTASPLSSIASRITPRASATCIAVVALLAKKSCSTAAASGLVSAIRAVSSRWSCASRLGPAIRAGVVSTPKCESVRLPPALRTRATPVVAMPGSTPRTSVSVTPGVSDRLAELFQLLRVDVEVGVDLLGLVGVFERLHQPKQGRRITIVGNGDGLARGHRQLGLHDLGAELLQALPDLLEVIRLGLHLQLAVADLDVGGAQLDHLQRQLLGILTRRVGEDDALALEDPAHRTLLGDVAAVAGEDAADLRRGAVAVVGQGIDHDCHPAGPVALVAKLLVLDATLLAGATLDGAVDVVGGHVDLAGLLDSEAETEVGGGVSPTLLGSDRDLSGHLRENGALFGVGGRLLVLDRRPLGVSGHGSESKPGTAGRI